MMLASQGAMAAPYPAGDGFLGPNSYPYGGAGSLATGPPVQATGDCSEPGGLVTGIIKGVLGGYGDNCGTSIIPGGSEVYNGGGLVGGII